MAARVRSAVLWRSGSQIVAQLVMWSSTFIVIRLLAPSDYGLFAMTQLVLSLMSLLNGYSFTASLVQGAEMDRTRVAQVFGMMILLNFGLAAIQVALAPAAASYFREPMVAQLLRVQALLHLTTPFIMVPQALLSRQIDFRTQARVNIAAAALAAIVAPTCAYAGLGVWTLVAAPFTLFSARAVGMLIVGRWWIWPSFRWRGAGATIGFGSAMLVSDLLWFVQTQADVFIAGRRLEPHALGLYTTGLFLSQILVNKFVPAINEVAFPTYARLQHDPQAIARGFLRAVRLVMLAAIPFYLGLAATAEPLVLTVLGDHWAGAVPVVRLLALAMPCVTLQILYAPATNALGRPGIAARVSGAGAIIMPIAFLIGVGHGPVGMAAAWLGGFPLLLIAATALSLPVIGLRARDLLTAVTPPLAAGLGMAAGVLALDFALPPLPVIARLAALVAMGAILYPALLLVVARGTLTEAIALARGRTPA
nr:lipopolysaccharide biosynthesis protein [Sphingomonas jatrophae]